MAAALKENETKFEAKLKLIEANLKSGKKPSSSSSSGGPGPLSPSGQQAHNQASNPNSSKK